LLDALAFLSYISSQLNPCFRGRLYIHESLLNISSKRLIAATECNRFTRLDINVIGPRTQQCRGGRCHVTAYCTTMSDLHSAVFVIHFLTTVCKTVRPMLLDRRPVLSCLSVTLVYCGQTVGRIKMKLGMLVGLGPGRTVLDGDPAPPRKGAQQPPHSKFTCAGFACLRIIRGPCLL